MSGRQRRHRRHSYGSGDASRYLLKKRESVLAAINAESAAADDDFQECIADSPQCEQLPVTLHIYDVGFVPRWMNAIARASVGGAFHVGVEVAYREWYFGASQKEGAPGISWNMPRCHPDHTYRSSVHVGNTSLTRDGILELLTDMGQEYTGTAYRLTTKNCLHFSEDLCRRLGLPEPDLPAEIVNLPNRLGQVSQLFSSAKQRISGTSETPAEDAEKEDDDAELNVTLGQRLMVCSGPNRGEHGVVVGWTTHAGFLVKSTSGQPGTIRLQLDSCQAAPPDGLRDFDLLQLGVPRELEIFRPAPDNDPDAGAGSCIGTRAKVPKCDAAPETFFEAASENSFERASLPEGPTQSNKDATLPTPGQGLFRMLLGGACIAREFSDGT